ncbi:unnamed protein product, partial [Gulo gulo]
HILLTVNNSYITFSAHDNISLFFCIKLNPTSVSQRTKLAENSTSDSTSAKDPEETMPPLKELKSPETSSFNQLLSKLTICSAA